MMKDLYSWLQSEANLSDLNEYLYKKSLHKSLDKEAEYQNIVNWINTLLEDNIDIYDILNKENIKLEIKKDTSKSFIHAQYIEDEKLIWINELWLDKYKKLMSEKEAITLHLAHEIYHVIEEKSKPWYMNYRYKKSHSISEVCAIYFSQKLANLSYHPSLYTYQIDLLNAEYTKEDLLNYLIKERR